MDMALDHYIEFNRIVREQGNLLPVIDKLNSKRNMTKVKTVKKPKKIKSY